MKKEVKVASIPMESITKPTSDDFEIKKNFPCLKCQQFPVGSVQQCTECEGFYCEWCAEDNKKEKKTEPNDFNLIKPSCCNKECKSETFKTVPIGKILKNMIITFEFKHDC